MSPRMQDSEANCGVYAVRNALYSLGIVRNAAELEKPLRATATRGTEQKHIEKYLSAVEGCTVVRIKEKRFDVARLLLEDALRRGRPVVISWTTEKPGDHWVAAIGLLGARYLIADSGEMELVLSVEEDELREKWGCPAFDGVVL